MTTPLIIPAADGFELGATLYEPEQPKTQAVLISAATGVKRGYYHNFATFLAENGYTTLTYDYRGVGESLPTDIRQFHAAMSDWGSLDLTGVIAWLKGQYPAYPLFLVAHSVGGVMLGLTPLHHHLKGAFLVASPNYYWRYASPLQRLILLYMCYLHIPFSERFLGYYNSRLLGTGENLPKGIMSEWANWVASPGYVSDCLPPEKLFYEQVKMPLHALSIEDDQFVTPAAVHALLEFYSQAPQTYEHITPPAGQHIGHTGFFRSRFKATLWEKALAWLHKTA